MAKKPSPTVDEGKAPETDGLIGYRVLTPLKHTGVRYAPGDVVQLTTQEAEALGELGIVGDVVSDEDGTEGGKQPPA